jgi:hypothetical protein
MRINVPLSSLPESGCQLAISRVIARDTVVQHVHVVSIRAVCPSVVHAEAEHSFGGNSRALEEEGEHEPCEW